MTDAPAFDLFISHAEQQDGARARDLCEQLEAHGLRCFLAPRDMEPGGDWPTTLARAIPRCRMLVLLLSRAAIGSHYVPLELERAVTQGVPVFPVRLEPVRPDERLEIFLSRTHWFDVQPRTWDQALPELVRFICQRLPERAPPAPGEPTSPTAADLPAQTLVAPKRIALLYKRRAEPDGRVLQALEAELNAAGHRVFVDRHLTMGVEWAQEIETEIRAADAVVVLLSRASVASEMLVYEVEIAAKAAQERAGKPRLLPVRLGFEEPLPSELAPHLERLQYVLWQGPKDDAALFAGVSQALEEPPTRPTPLHPLERDSGAVPLDSKFYVVRRVDAEIAAALARRDTIVLVKGARQMGKTSLLARTMEQARQAGVRVVLTDLQKLPADQFASLDAFFRALTELIADQLDLAVFPDQVWQPGRSPVVNLERYLRREVLEANPGPLLWAMDEVDRLFSCPFGGDVLALFRTWHNACALDPSKPWSRMTMAIAYATEAHLFITDPNQSPFNVGTKIELADFTREQVADLNRRYGSPLREPAELLRLYALLNGQPYLTRHALNTLVAENLRLADLEAVADRDDGPFSDHLRRILLMLGREPTLTEAVRTVLAGGPCPDFGRFYRLRSAGILAGDGRDQARPRCGLYERYLRRQLP